MLPFPRFENLQSPEPAVAELVEATRDRGDWPGDSGAEGRRMKNVSATPASGRGTGRANRPYRALWMVFLRPVHARALGLLVPSMLYRLGVRFSSSRPGRDKKGGKVPDLEMVHAIDVRTKGIRNPGRDENGPKLPYLA